MVIQNKRILQILKLLNKNNKTITGKNIADSINYFCNFNAKFVVLKFDF